jgi:hypothetical protein
VSGKFGLHSEPVGIVRLEAIQVLRVRYAQGPL